MKYLLVVLDGAPDRPNPKLGYKTPLEYAGMQHLNKLARESVMGSMYSVAKGIAPESDAAVFSILSYDVKSYTGRGPLEALGSGLKVDSHTLALRANFATIDKERRIVDRRAGRDVTEKEAKALEKELNKINLGIRGVKFRFKATVGHRGVLVFYARPNMLSANVSNADIGYVKRGNISVAVSKSNNKIPEVKPLDKSAQAKFTAFVLNKFLDKAIETLSKSKVNRERKKEGRLEANAVLFRDGGIGLPKVRSINDKFKLRFAFLAEMPVEIGIAKLLGMKRISWKSSHKNDIKEYRLLAKKIMESANKCDFLYVHIKGPDEPGHDGDAVEKARRLKAIDSGFFANLDVEKLGATVCVTADHSTPCTLKAHSSDPVPVMIYSKNIKPDGLEFNEHAVKKGSLGIILGKELIKTIMKYGA